MGVIGEEGCQAVEDKPQESWHPGTHYDFIYQSLFLAVVANRSHDDHIPGRELLACPQSAGPFCNR